MMKCSDVSVKACSGIMSRSCDASGLHAGKKASGAAMTAKAAYLKAIYQVSKAVTAVTGKASKKGNKAGKAAPGKKGRKVAAKQKEAAAAAAAVVRPRAPSKRTSKPSAVMVSSLKRRLEES